MEYNDFKRIFVPLQCILSRKKTRLKDVDWTENSLTANFQKQRKICRGRGCNCGRLTPALPTASSIRKIL